jgi:hypothetical protein
MRPDELERINKLHKAREAIYRSSPRSKWVPPDEPDAAPPNLTDQQREIYDAHRVLDSVPVPQGSLVGRVRALAESHGSARNLLVDAIEERDRIAEEVNRLRNELNSVRLRLDKQNKQGE